MNETYFFIGPQGSGKGTQAKILASKLGLFYWEMGGILREVAASGSELGQKVKNLIDSGVLLKDEDLYEVVKSRLGQVPKDQGVIFDGIPRRMAQAQFLLDFLKSQGRSSFTTIYINLTEQESVARLLKRAELEKRADDTLEKIKYRLEQYKKDTVPVLEYLKKQGKFFEIDGAPAVEIVTQKINQALGIN